MGNGMYAYGVEDALLLALEEARIVWEKTRDGGKVINCISGEASNLAIHKRF